jgi:hypothetical protein
MKEKPMSFINPKQPRSMSALARSIFPERAKEQDAREKPVVMRAAQPNWRKEFNQPAPHRDPDDWIEAIPGLVRRR